MSAELTSRGSRTGRWPIPGYPTSDFQRHRIHRPDARSVVAGLTLVACLLGVSSGFFRNGQRLFRCGYAFYATRRARAYRRSAHASPAAIGRWKACAGPQCSWSSSCIMCRAVRPVHGEARATHRTRVSAPRACPRKLTPCQTWKPLIITTCWKSDSAASRFLRSRSSARRGCA